LLLSLEVACRQPQADVETVRTQLEEMIRSIHLIETNHKLILHYIDQLTSADAMSGMRCLQKYILHRLLPESNVVWVEQSIVKYVAVHCNSRSTASTSTIQALQNDLDTYYNALQSGMSLGASQAAQVLI